MVRFSLCCGREGCRRRATPPSLRFLGLSGVPGGGGDRGEPGRAVAGDCGGEPAGDGGTGADDAAVGRVVAWPVHRDGGVRSRSARGWLGVAIGELPASIIAKLAGTWPQRVRAALRALVPLTTGSLPAGSPFLRVTA